LFFLGSVIFSEELNKENFDATKDLWPNTNSGEICAGNKVLTQKDGKIEKKIDFSNALPGVFFTISFYLERLNDWNHDLFAVTRLSSGTAIFSQHLGVKYVESLLY
jgi:hypothetical protein